MLIPISYFAVFAEPRNAPLLREGCFAFAYKMHTGAQGRAQEEAYPPPAVVTS